jgi:hypothetical protein
MESGKLYLSAFGVRFIWYVNPPPLVFGTPSINSLIEGKCCEKGDYIPVRSS